MYPKNIYVKFDIVKTGVFLAQKHLMHPAATFAQLKKIIWVTISERPHPRTWQEERQYILLFSDSGQAMTKTKAAKRN